MHKKGESKTINSDIKDVQSPIKTTFKPNKTKTTMVSKSFDVGQETWKDKLTEGQHTFGVEKNKWI